MPDQALRTSKAISNVLVLYKISMYMRPIKKYGRPETNYIRMFPINGRSEVNQSMFSD
jgi:hypothetical protein